MTERGFTCYFMISPQFIEKKMLEEHIADLQN